MLTIEIKKKLTLLPGAVLIALVSTTLVADEAVTLKNIMQGLRDDLVVITDGLLTENFELIAIGAAAIADHPKIPPNQVQLVAEELGPEMASFKRLDMLVHDLSLEINVAARSRDRQLVMDHYQQLIDGCFACHGDYKERVAAVLSPDASIPD